MFSRDADHVTLAFARRPQAALADQLFKDTVLGVRLVLAPGHLDRHFPIETLTRAVDMLPGVGHVNATGTKAYVDADTAHDATLLGLLLENDLDGRRVEVRGPKF